MAAVYVSCHLFTVNLPALVRFLFASVLKYKDTYISTVWFTLSLMGGDFGQRQVFLLP